MSQKSSPLKPIALQGASHEIVSPIVLWWDTKECPWCKKAQHAESSKVLEKIWSRFRGNLSEVHSYMTTIPEVNGYAAHPREFSVNLFFGN